MIELQVSLAQSDGARLHFGLDYKCQRICTDESILEALGIKKFRNKSRKPLLPDVRLVEDLLNSGKVSAIDLCLPQTYTFKREPVSLLHVSSALERMRRFFVD
jgi:hypothetical protein